MNLVTPLAASTIPKGSRLLSSGQSRHRRPVSFEQSLQRDSSTSLAHEATPFSINVAGIQREINLRTQFNAPSKLAPSLKEGALVTLPLRASNISMILPHCLALSRAGIRGWFHRAHRASTPQNGPSKLACSFSWEGGLISLLLRASTEHIPIVRGLRAQRLTGHPPLFSV